MLKIAYTGLHPETVSQITSCLNQDSILFSEISRPDVFNIEGKQDALLIGEEVENPLKFAQQVHKLDEQLSILIIKDIQDFRACQQELLFTPFVGKTVKCTSNADAIMLASTINEVASQTSNRRNYQKLRNTRISLEAVATPEALKRAYVDTFFDQVPIGAVLTNDYGIVLAINAHVTGLLKLQESDILGKSIITFFPDHEKNKLKDLLTKQDSEIRDEIVGRSVGENQYIRVIVSSIKDIRFSNYKSILLTDVTERMTSRKRIEEQLEELNASNEELKKVNADLDSFIYTASHDLKAPVSNIEGLIHSLRDSLVAEYEQIKPETEMLLGMIDQSVARFQETLLDLTEVIKTQRAEGEDIKILNCASVIYTVIQNLQEEVKKAGGEIEMDNAPECNISFSKKNFRSIVYNLISNAIKYRSPDRKLKIFIKTEVTQNYIILTVRDNGLGISQDNISRMFTMFKRFHDHVEGTGIGLYIVKRIIDNSGGKIEVDSEVGKGTTFRVYFKA